MAFLCAKKNEKIIPQKFGCELKNIHLCNIIYTTTPHTMTSFNQNLTIEEATALFHYKGAAMWPDTKHNLEMMASLVEAKLRKLQGK